MKYSLILIFLFVPALYSSASGYQNLSASIGGGYAGNLFADSFNIANSYLVNNVSISSTNFQKVKLKLYYGIYYYEYDTDNRINNFLHMPGLAVYRQNLSQKFKWGLGSYAAIKDYISSNTNFDNYRIVSTADMSYYFKSGLQGKASYQLTRAHYQKYNDLNNYEHWANGELVFTLPSRTTIRGTGRYYVRRFDKDHVTFHWIDTELGISQSLDIKTGIGLTFLKRWSNGGERPLSSYYIISGITSYWDPWDGSQVDASIKRILPYAVIVKLDGSYWDRKFTYDKYMQAQLPWLNGNSGRRDKGWLAKAELSRQFNYHPLTIRSFKIAIRGGYLNNRSDDQFYKYDNFSLDTNLEINIF